MAIKCRNGEAPGGSHTHESVQEVRACQGVDGLFDRASGGSGETLSDPRAPLAGHSRWGMEGSRPGGWRADPITERQEGAIRSAMARRGLEFAEGHLMPTRKGPASDLIAVLKSDSDVSPRMLRDLHLVRVLSLAVVPGAEGAGSGLENGPLRHVPVAEAPPARSAVPVPVVAEGLYATRSLTGNNDLDFWRVKHGRRPGIVFVNRVIGGHQDAALPSDSKARIKTERVARVTQQAALKAILEAPGGPSAAHELAGIELKFCRECGIHLTDETSRALGIGPVCRSK